MINITLDELVNSYLDSWELPDSQYRRIFNLGVRGYRQIYMHAAATPMTVELEVLGNKTSDLPCDCLNKISLGVINANGDFAPLTEHPSLGFANDDDPDRLGEKTQPNLVIKNDSGIFYDVDGNHIAPYVYTQMGVGARSDLGFYRIDLENRVIVYDFNFKYATVWLEYLPVFSDNGEYNVNPFFMEAILAFIEWKDMRRSPSDRNTAKINFYNELRIGKRSIKPFDISQAQLAYNRSARIARF